MQNIKKCVYFPNILVSEFCEHQTTIVKSVYKNICFVSGRIVFESAFESLNIEIIQYKHSPNTTIQFINSAPKVCLFEKDTNPNASLIYLQIVFLHLHIVFTYCISTCACLMYICKSLSCTYRYVYA